MNFIKFRSKRCGLKIAGERFSKSQSAVRRYTRSNAGNVCYFIFISFFAVFSVLPLIYSVITSFKPLDELLAFPPRFFVVRPTLNNYLALPKLLSNLTVPLSRYVFNSVFICVVSTSALVVISAMAAFVLAKSRLKGRKAIFLIIQFSLLFNAYTLAIPQYLIFSKMGIIDNYWVYILPFLPSTMGVFLMKQYIESSIPDTLLEAAKIDGAGYMRSFTKLVFPMIKPVILTLSLFAFRDIWSTQPQGTIFSEQMKILPSVMSQITAGGIARSGSAMAATVIMMVPPIIVYFFTQSNVSETMNSAGIKE